MLNSKQNIGKLDRRITFQEKVVGSNESNEDEETGWTNIDDDPTVWASKEERPVASGEEYRADKLTDYQHVTFVVRYRDDITPLLTVVYGTTRYNILSVQEVSRKRFLNIECESGGEYVGEISITEGAFSDGFSDGFLI